MASFIHGFLMSCIANLFYYFPLLAGMCLLEQAG
uniref:Uncharacterized protein n=1 Tax=Arundo donax TaxID=35708 RepID=A0A0A9GFG1_ARUDO